jgi:hypothetical protein
MGKNARDTSLNRHIAAATAAIMLVGAAPAQAWPGAQPPAPYDSPQGGYYDPPPYPSHPPRCNGSEPLTGGIYGATLGGLIGSLLGRDRYGRVDPGATVFGVITGAMLGATIAASRC